MQLIQRRLNVDATSWRFIDVEPTLYKRHVPAGIAWEFMSGVLKDAYTISVFRFVFIKAYAVGIH